MSKSLHKYCDCKSSSSGPRFISYQATQKDGSLDITGRLAQLVCDECNTAWENTPKPIDLPAGPRYGVAIKGLRVPEL